jgi:hypothetical protein
MLSHFDIKACRTSGTIEVNKPSPVSPIPSLRARSTSACAHARLESFASKAAGNTSPSSTSVDGTPVVVPLLICAILLHEARPTRTISSRQYTNFRTGPSFTPSAGAKVVDALRREASWKQHLT